jgi:hypothetical protein
MSAIAHSLNFAFCFLTCLMIPWTVTIRIDWIELVDVGVKTLLEVPS